MYSDEAYEYWRSGKTREAGRLIFEKLSVGDRPIWASRILELVVNRTGVKSQPIENIIYISKHPSEWGKAHSAFSSARKLMLQLKQSSELTAEQLLLIYHLGLAELVAKVVYNSTNPSDEFDQDSGWSIATILKKILDLLGDKEFSQFVWSALCLENKMDKR